jgi:hypothetical protein
VLAEAHDAPPAEMEPVRLHSFDEAFSLFLSFFCSSRLQKLSEVEYLEQNAQEKK